MEEAWVTAWASAKETNKPLPSPLGAAAEHKSSTALMDLRTSPPQAEAMWSTTPSSREMGCFWALAWREKARRTAWATSSGVTGLNSNTVLRLRMAL